MTNERDRRIWERILEAAPELAELFPRSPSYRYFIDKRGWMYCWTVERTSDGKYSAFIYRPTGKGSRSGAKKVQSWKLSREVKFTKRSSAKARALRWYKQDQTEEES